MISSRANIKAALRDNVHFLLHGHLHNNDIDAVLTEHDHRVILTAGAAYDTRRYPNRALYCQWQENKVTIFPIRYEDQPREVWTLYSSRFHRLPIPGPIQLAPESAPSPTPPALAPHFQSNIPVRRKLPFVGRDALLREVHNLWKCWRNRACSRCTGSPAWAKSELACEYARAQQGRYPGGTFLIDFTTGTPPLDLARVAEKQP